MVTIVVTEVLQVILQIQHATNLQRQSSNEETRQSLYQGNCSPYLIINTMLVFDSLFDIAERQTADTSHQYKTN